MWTSEKNGWVIAFKEPYPETCNYEEIQAIFKKLFLKLRHICPKGVKLKSVQSLVGTLFVAGSNEACLELQKRLKSTNLAHMEENRSKVEISYGK